MRKYQHVVYLRNYTILICSKCYKKQALVNSRQISLYLKDNLYCKRMSIFLINYTSVTLVSLNGYKQRLPFCERGREKTLHLQSRRSSSRKQGASKSFSVILRDKEAPLLVNNAVETSQILRDVPTKRGSRPGRFANKTGSVRT